MTTTADRAAAIRKSLKANGLNARAVSVRCDYYSMGSTIYVTVRKFGISAAKVTMLVQSFQRIDRCEISGDILTGGNTFVDVSYAAKLNDAAKDALRETVAKARAEAIANPGTEIEVVPGMAAIWYDKNGDDIRLGSRRIWNSEDATLCGVVGHVLQQGWAPAN